MVKRLALVTVVALGVGWLLTPPRLAEQRVTVTPFSVVVEPVEPIPIVHKDRIILPNNMMCPQWAQIAIDTGWQEEDLAMLDHIIHRESRCYSAVHYSQDPNGGSYGLMQVNAYWCKPSDWYPNGYLQAFGVLDNCEQLFEPRINLLSARLIWLYSLREHDDGWLPWQT